MYADELYPLQKGTNHWQNEQRRASYGDALALQLKGGDLRSGATVDLAMPAMVPAASAAGAVVSAGSAADADVRNHSPTGSAAAADVARWKCYGRGTSCLEEEVHKWARNGVEYARSKECLCGQKSCCEGRSRKTANWRRFTQRMSLRRWLTQTMILSQQVRLAFRQPSRACRRAPQREPIPNLRTTMWDEGRSHAPLVGKVITIRKI